MPYIPPEEIRQDAALALLSYAASLTHPISALMLRHAIDGKGAFLHFDKDDDVSETVKETQWYQNLLTQALTKGVNSDPKQFDLSGSTDFAGTWDLGYAFGKVDYRITGAEVIPFKWMVTLRLNDTYDFEEYPEIARSLKDILNKL